MMLETVAAVPGMVGGILFHYKLLMRLEQSGGCIKALLEEAENKRMHLMTFMEVAKTKWYERALVFAVQGVFFNAYFVTYILSPKLAHHIVGYLKEEAIHSYTEFLKELGNGNIENVPAPAIAIDYWHLPKKSTLRDIVVVVRADEAHHRDVNYFVSDSYFQGQQLMDSPAPLGFCFFPQLQDQGIHVEVASVQCNKESVSAFCRYKDQLLTCDHDIPTKDTTVQSEISGSQFLRKDSIVRVCMLKVELM
ncbi:Ubiquinol oxidase 2, mitochondrial [Capsicum baccatum]|uniref:Ubiquinol oxidase n=1 Tax=Capsicum baccatum TaxID=33114 RepID=A0A2G2VZ75_CAPBA|nr:Ubiquinol oxidase 2, mitochondrial [Capsicum baccatum]